MRDDMGAIESMNPSSHRFLRPPTGFGHAAQEWTRSGLSWEKLCMR
jgi:hypothetical protein